MGHKVCGARTHKAVPRAGLPGRPWSRFSVDALLAATAAGRAEALHELFRRHGTPAVNLALRSLLDAGGDEACMLDFLRRAAALRPSRREHTAWVQGGRPGECREGQRRM
jgi:hypothetical protein